MLASIENFHFDFFFSKNEYLEVALIIIQLGGLKKELDSELNVNVTISCTFFKY